MKTNHEPIAQEVFHDIWKVLFTPSPPVANAIQEQFRDLEIFPGDYASAHIRVLYKVKDRSEKDHQKIVENAMNCASQLRP